MLMFRIMKTRSEYSSALGANIRERMHEVGIGSMAIAVQLGTSQMAVQRHLRGDAMPGIEQLQRYAEILGVKVDDLLPRVGSNHQPAGSGSRAVA